MLIEVGGNDTKPLWIESSKVVGVSAKPPTMCIVNVACGEKTEEWHLCDNADRVRRAVDEANGIVMEDDKFVYRRRLGDSFIWKVKRTPEGDGLHVGTAYCATVITMDWRRAHCPVDIESYAPVSESEVRGFIRYAEATLNKEKRIKELELKLAKMVRWLDEHQPDVWKRGLWDALEPE